MPHVEALSSEHNVPIWLWHVVGPGVQPGWKPQFPG
jgi:hypothetical protein